MTTGRPAFRAVVLLLGALVLAGCAASPTVRAAAAPGKTVRVTGVSGPVTILLDRHGIPHISAGSEADAAFAMGYMHARDRRFQMELLRMDALGRLRELLGSRVPPAVLRLELFSRALGFAREARDVLDNFPAEDQRILAAYADGVNAATAYEPEPLELHLLGYEPQPWTAADSLAILQTISFGFCKDWEQELVRLEIVVHQLRQGSTIDHALGIWPPRFDFPPHLIGVKPAKDPFAAIAPMAPELASSLLENLSASLAPVSPLVPPAATDPLSRALDLRFLSNNWAVSGTWTGTGKSAFAIDPHMPSSLPPLPYIVAVQLDSATEGSYHIIGASFPGLPAVPFGTNGAVAWGPTSNWADVTDLYVEKPAPGRPGFYQTEDGDRPFGSRGRSLSHPPREVFHRGKTNDSKHAARRPCQRLCRQAAPRLPPGGACSRAHGGKLVPAQHPAPLSGRHREGSEDRVAGLHRHGGALGPGRRPGEYRLRLPREPSAPTELPGDRSRARLEREVRLEGVRRGGGPSWHRESSSGVHRNGQQPGGPAGNPPAIPSISRAMSRSASSESSPGSDSEGPGPQLRPR